MNKTLQTLSILSKKKLRNTKWSEHVEAVRRAPANPMTREEGEAKCRDLIDSILGKEQTQRLIEKIRCLEKVTDMRELQPLIAKE